MGCDFNLHEDEWAKEDNDALQTMLTSEEIKIEQLEKVNKELREKVHFWKKEVNVAHKARSDEFDNLYASREYYKRELDKAKELLEMTLDWQCRCGNGHPTWQEVCAEIEQFLKGK